MVSLEIDYGFFGNRRESVEVRLDGFKATTLGNRGGYGYSVYANLPAAANENWALSYR